MNWAIYSMKWLYSGTPLGLFQTPWLIADFVIIKFVWFQMLAYIDLQKLPPWFTDTLIFPKADKLSFSTTFTWTVQSALDTHWLFIVHGHQWIQRLSIVLALLFILLVFLSYSNREIWKCDLIMFNSLTTQYHTNQKYTKSPEWWLPLYSGQAVVVSMVSALKGFHCILNFKCFREI